MRSGRAARTLLAARHAAWRNVGISSGFALWFYTLILPALVKEGVLSETLLQHGLFGVGWLRPTGCSAWSASIR